jgi:hypothetical protein
MGQKCQRALPQQNGVVEHCIVLLCDRAHTQFLTAGLKPAMINLLWAEAISKAKTDKNVTCTSFTKTCAYQALHGKKPRILPYLIQLGWIGIVTNHRSFKGKWKERGEKEIAIGYGADQSRDTQVPPSCNQSYSNLKRLQVVTFFKT